MPTIALSIFDLAGHVGYPLVALIVVLETGCGIPFAPGELAVVTAAIAAADGELQLPWLIAVAAASAIMGDNIGYMVGRHGGRRLLERPGVFYKQRQFVLGIADPFFEKHGPKAVFIGRWLPVLRVYASWLAGASRMPWKAFVFWNASGGICWAVSLSLIGYFAGAAGKSFLESAGKFGPVFVIGGIIVAVLVYRRSEREAVEWVRRKSQPDLPTLNPEESKP
jgi:membrane protein DedA with SNARE-associated domain